MKSLLLISLGVVALVYLAVWVRGIRRSPVDIGAPTWPQSGIGFVTNFFDTLGIGSFAPTTALFRMWRIVPDERIPGTLNVGHSLPTIAQAFIYIAIIKVDVLTLVVLIASSTLGAWLGAGVVARWPRRKIQIGMGLALLAASGLFVATNLQLVPGGGEALTLRGQILMLATLGNFILGALMTLGIGLYAPCLIMLSLFGMNPKAVFPIMMGSCAFLMPIASIRFIREGAYSFRPALGLAVAGVPAVLIAAFVVRSLPLTAVRWLVTVVVLYTAITMLTAAYREPRHLAAESLPVAK
ncbi:MAG TPA: sulfite exporter TauE/SafE family protein [Terriglobales bacterium]